MFLERAASPSWRNTLSFLFGRYMAAFNVATRPLALLRELASDLSPDGFGLQLVVADCAEMLQANGYRLDDGSAERLHEMLLGSMRARASAKERCEAGTSLGKVRHRRAEGRAYFGSAYATIPVGRRRPRPPRPPGPATP